MLSQNLFTTFGIFFFLNYSLSNLIFRSDLDVRRNSSEKKSILSRLGQGLNIFLFRGHIFDLNASWLNDVSILMLWNLFLNIVNLIPYLILNTCKLIFRLSLLKIRSQFICSVISKNWISSKFLRRERSSVIFKANPSLVVLTIFIFSWSCMFSTLICCVL